MLHRVFWSAAALALAPFALSQNGYAQVTASVAAHSQIASTGRFVVVAASRKVVRTAGQPTRVYLLRGLWNVWSYGMDDLANKLRGVGVEAVVVNHSAWPQIADTLIKQRAAGEYAGPIVLVGHSLGGDDIIRAAQALGAAGVTVDLLMPVDAVSPMPVPANVARVINFYQANNGWGQPLRPGDGFRGAFSNADLESNRRDLREVNTTHTSIDKGPKVHAEIIREVLKLRGRRTATHAKPRVRTIARKQAPQQASPPTQAGAAVSAAAATD